MAGVSGESFRTMPPFGWSTAMLGCCSFDHPFPIYHSPWWDERDDRLLHVYFRPQMKGKLSPGPSGRPEATSVTCSYSMQLSTSLWRTLNCTCQVTVTQPRHSIFIIRQKLQNNGRKLSIRLSGSASPVLGSSFPHPYPLPCCDLATYSCLTHGLSWF